MPARRRAMLLERSDGLRRSRRKVLNLTPFLLAPYHTRRVWHGPWQSKHHVLKGSTKHGRDPTQQLSHSIPCASTQHRNRGHRLATPEKPRLGCAKLFEKAWRSA